MDNPRSLPSTRITNLFPFPAQGYMLGELPPGEVDLRHLGLRLANPETTHRIRDELAPYPWPGGKYAFVEERGPGLWLFWTKEDRHYLSPYPPERIPFENGDKVYDVGFYKNYGRVRLGKVDNPPGRRVVGGSDILWEGELVTRSEVFASFGLYLQWILPAPPP